MLEIGPVNATSHKIDECVDIAALPKQECEFGFLKGGQEAPGEVFPFNRRDADGGILRDTPAEALLSSVVTVASPVVSVRSWLSVPAVKMLRKLFLARSRSSAARKTSSLDPAAAAPGSQTRS